LFTSNNNFLHIVPVYAEKFFPFYMQIIVVNERDWCYNIIYSIYMR